MHLSKEDVQGAVPVDKQHTTVLTKTKILVSVSLRDTLILRTLRMLPLYGVGVGNFDFVLFKFLDGH